jgi:hypothetical protein
MPDITEAYPAPDFARAFARILIKSILTGSLPKPKSLSESLAGACNAQAAALYWIRVWRHMTYASNEDDRNYLLKLANKFIRQGLLTLKEVRKMGFYPLMYAQQIPVAQEIYHSIFPQKTQKDFDLLENFKRIVGSSKKLCWNYFHELNLIRKELERIVPANVLYYLNYIWSKRSGMARSVGRTNLQKRFATHWSIQTSLQTFVLNTSTDLSLANLKSLLILIEKTYKKYKKVVVIESELLKSLVLNDFTLSELKKRNLFLSKKSEQIATWIKQVAKTQKKAPSKKKKLPSKAKK